MIDLIGKCLTINPEKRPTIDEVLHHEWIKDKSNSTFAFIDRIKRSVKHAVKPVLTKRSSLFFKNPKKISPDASDIESIIYIILQMYHLQIKDLNHHHRYINHLLQHII